PITIPTAAFDVWLSRRRALVLYGWPSAATRFVCRNHAFDTSGVATEGHPYKRFERRATTPFQENEDEQVLQASRIADRLRGRGELSGAKPVDGRQPGRRADDR